MAYDSTPCAIYWPPGSLPASTEIRLVYHVPEFQIAIIDCPCRSLILGPTLELPKVDLLGEILGYKIGPCSWLHASLTCIPPEVY